MTMTKQRGMSFSAMMATMVLIAFFALLAIRVIPLYLEWGTVSGALDSLVEGNLGKQGKPAMVKRINAQFQVDNVESISARDIVFIRAQDAKVWRVTAEYEARANLYNNVGVFIQFNKTVEVPR